MNLYARKGKPVKQIQQQYETHNVESSGHVKTDFKEWKFDIAGPLGWAVLIVVFIFGLLIIKGKYRIGIFSYIKTKRKSFSSKRKKKKSKKTS